jgi:hypothetical protein
MENAAIGGGALISNTTGMQNAACGAYALQYNTGGIGNTAIGDGALMSNITGNYNTAVGYLAGPLSGNLTNTIAIGNNASINTSNRVNIGNASISWIGGQVTWSTYSDGRFKRNVNENVPGLAFITKLRPVTFNWDIHGLNKKMGVADTNQWEGKYDIERQTISGFIAQEVAKAADETGYDFSGIDSTADIYSLSYGQFVVPLVKAVQELKAENDRLKARIEKLERAK